MKKQTGKFAVINVNGTGRPETAVEFTNFQPSGDFGNPGAMTPVNCSYALLGGEPLNLLDDGTFEGVHTGRKMRRV